MMKVKVVFIIKRKVKVVLMMKGKVLFKTL